MRLQAVFAAVVLLVLLGLLNQVGLLKSSSLRPAAQTTLELPASVISHCAAVARPPKVDVSIIAVGCNRTSSLQRVLPSWLALQGVAEIVLLDWGSQPPLHTVLSAPLDSRIRIVRAPLESEWNLARAYNLVIQLATGEILLKLDSDTRVHPQLLARQPLGPLEFRRGCSHRST